MLYNSPILDKLNALSPSTEICIDGKNTLSAQDLIKDSISYAQNLKEQGVNKGDIVLFAVATGSEFLKTFMALVHIRATIALVDPHMGPQLYESKIRQLKPKWAFIDRRLLLLQQSKPLRLLYKYLNPKGFYINESPEYSVFGTGPNIPLIRKPLQVKRSNHKPQFIEGDPDDELVIVYTSGSLAEPKGVVQSVQTIFESLQVIASMLENTPGMVMVSHLPHFALIGMMVGYQVHFWDENLSQKERIKFIEKHQIDTIFGPPAEFLALMNWCQKQNRLFPTSLQHIILGSAPVLKPFLLELRKFYTNKVTCYYGMTEHVMNSIIDGDEKLKNPSKEDLLGKPYAGIQYKIAEDGELFVQSPWLFKRYFHEKTRPDFHATGDLVKLDSDGNLLMMGRKKNMIIRKHKNIYPALYEPTINSIPGINDCCMVGVYNAEKHDEDVYLLVDTVAEHLNESEILKLLRQGKYEIDSDALPDYILMEEIPRFGRQQKVNYQHLKARLNAAPS
ncbi:MAG: hypothetical protein Salg2KO_03980 [Salibacteraceae bacterium]